MRNLAVLFLLIFVSSELALASDDGIYRRLRPVIADQHAGHEHTRVFDGSLTPDMLAIQLVDDIHEISHDHEERKQLTTFATNWVKQFNLVRAGRDLIRWGALRTHNNPELMEHAANLGLLFGASHLIETLSGPIGYAIGNAAGLPSIVNWAILGVGGVISVPGLDPICIMLAATYKMSPGFRMQITKTRITLKRVSIAVAKTIHLPQITARFGHWQSGKDRVLGQVEKTEDGLFLQLDGGRLEFAASDNRLWLARVQIDDALLFEKSWKQVRSGFDGNTRQAVTEAIDLKAEAQPFYVKNVESGERLKRINYVEGAILPWGKWQFCHNWLK